METTEAVMAAAKASGEIADKFTEENKLPREARDKFVKLILKSEYGMTAQAAEAALPTVADNTSAKGTNKKPRGAAAQSNARGPLNLEAPVASASAQPQDKGKENQAASSDTAAASDLALSDTAADNEAEDQGRRGLCCLRLC